MTEETPGTSTDPALGSEGDDDQLSQEDSLVDRGVEDLLDEGYSPLDRPRSNHFGETPWEESHGETLDQRLAEEEPEVWAAPTRTDEDRVGRLVEDADAVDAGGNDEFAVESGIAGGAASAEEGAVHLVPEEFSDGPGEV